MAGKKNTVSVLMEHGQGEGVKPEFKEICALGESHTLRFLCQWSYKTRTFPAVFARSKKLAKSEAATLALEELGLCKKQERRFVIFRNNQVPSTVVEVSSTEGVDKSLFSPCPISDTDAENSQNNAMLNGSHSSFEGNRPNPFSNSFFAAPDNHIPERKQKMQAFDSKTIKALGLHNRTFITQEHSNSPLAGGHKSAFIPVIPPREMSTTEQTKREHNASSLHAGGEGSTSNHITPATPTDNDKTNSLDLASALASMKVEVEDPQDESNVVEENSGAVAAAAAKMCVNKNAISALYELGQQCHIRPEFQVLSQSGPPHQPTCTFGEIESTVSAPSKDSGKQQAFQEVLQQISVSNLLKSKKLGADVGGGAEMNKNPISLIMELGNQLSIIPEFECQQLSMTPDSRFEGHCKFGNRSFGPVVSQNKQQAKTEAFKLAWQELNADLTVKAELARHTHQIDSLSEIPVNGSESSADRHSPVDTEAISNLLCQKHPVSAILEYGQARRRSVEFEEMDDSGPAHCRSFTYRCKLNGKCYQQARARTKKAAKKHAAELALREMAGTTTSASDTKGLEGPPAPGSNVIVPANSKQPQQNDSQPKSLTLTPIATPKPITKSDVIAQHVYNRFSDMKANCGADLGKVILAGFVVENSSNQMYNVISIGTGNKCLTGEHLSVKGTTVNDCHAEVIARRGLLRFLYLQVEKFRIDMKQSIFHESDGGRLVMKPNLKLHLYISTAPCGDGALFTHNDLTSEFSNYSLDDEHSPVINKAKQGQLRSKMEVGEGTIPTNNSELQTYDGIVRGDRLKTMSCSDKICKWNVLGVQGTLLSDLIQPIYIDTLILGQLFHPGHLSRALCCRVRQFADKLAEVKSEFKGPCVKIDCTSQTLPRSTTKSKPVSINWMKYDHHCELLTAETGQVIPTSSDPTLNGSRLCKKQLYDTYNKLKSIKEPCYYGDAKEKVTEYCKSKEALYKGFRDAGLGTWLSKPEEQNMFH